MLAREQCDGWARGGRTPPGETGMSTGQDRVPLIRSQRAPVEGAQDVGAAHPNERVEVTVELRPRSAMEARLADTMIRPVQERQYLSRDELADARGADPADVAKVENFAHQYGLTVVQPSPGPRNLLLAGS